MDGETATMIFTDPLYHVSQDDHLGNFGKAQHREFAMASGEVSALEFTCFPQRAFRNVANHTIDSSIHFICLDWRQMGVLRIVSPLEASHAKHAAIGRQLLRL